MAVLDIVSEASPILPLQALYYNMNGSGLFLTEFDTTAVPAIAGNSVIMVGGKLFRANGSVSITDPGTLVDGQVYIELVLATDGLSVEPTFTNTFPDFDEAKQGRYSGDNLVLNIGMAYLSAGPTYSDKWQLLYIGNAVIKFRGSDNAIVADAISGVIFN